MIKTQQVLQGRYQLKQLLGQNAARQTWLAEDLSVQPIKLVIVKLLAFSPQMSWEELKLFEREAEVLKNLNHPRIPRYRDYFSVDDDREFSDLPWFGLVQDYIPGRSLSQLLQESDRMKEEDAIEAAKNILEILIYLHELSPPVIHRDIKPSNIILGENRQYYLVDFGAVQDRAKAEGVTFTVVGTNGYAPPEQLWGRAVPTSDLYALGATLIHLLTGISPADLPQRQMRIEFADLVNINPSLLSWIEEMIEPDAEKRFDLAREALNSLEAILSSKFATGIVSQSASSPVRYKRLALLSLSGIALSGIILGGFGLAMNSLLGNLSCGGNSPRPGQSK